MRGIKMLNKYKRLISLLTAVCISLGVVQPVLATENVPAYEGEIISDYSNINEDAEEELTDEEKWLPITLRWHSATEDA